ncbi:MAG: hypothetical protein ACJ8AO_19300 [Gemmatimonadaceae bacterium]
MLRVRFAPSALLALLALVLAACGDATGPGARLVGRWRNVTPLGPDARLETTFTFGTERFVHEQRYYGMYEGQSPDDLSASATTAGTYAIDGDAIDFDPETATFWDSRNGAQASPYTVAVDPSNPLYDEARVAVLGRVMVFTYVGVAPTDGREEKVLRFTRLAP